MARSDLEILAEVKLSNTREFNAQLRGLEKRKVIIDTKRSEQALGRITGKANEFTKSLEASNARVIAFGASVAVIEGVRRAFLELATTVVQVESSLNAINSIFGRSSDTISKFGDELFKVAKNTGQGFQQVAEAAQEFARQGLSVEQTLKRTNDALILTRLTTLNTEKAISGLTAVVNGFASSAITTTDVINKLRAVETAFAVSSTDLIDAVSRSASVAQDAGISFEELLGFITAIKQRTGLGGATIGQGLKTALTRLNLPTRIAQLKELGVAVDESAATFDNLVTASVAIDKAQKDGNRSLATQISTVVAGQFQVSKLSALFRDLASQQSIAGGATDAATKATNEAILANLAYNQTIEGVSKQISANISQIFAGLGEAGLQDFFKSIVTDINVLLEALQGKDIGGGSFLANLTKDVLLLANDLKLLAPLAEGFVKVLTGPAFVTGLAIIANTLKNVFTQGGASLLQLSGINKVSEKRIANQRVIQSLLAQATSSELKQLELATSQAQKEQIILGLLTKQLAAQKALESSSIRTAQSLSRQGVSLGGSVFTGDVSRKGRGTKGFAGGTLGGAIENEKRAISNGVGGASSNAQVKVVNSFNYGKGKIGPAVLNSDEILIPNKSGDIVLNRDMAGSSAISSMGGNFAKGKIPMIKGLTYKASQDGFSKLLMGNTKFQSVSYYSKNSDSVRQLTGVQHSSMVGQSSKAGKPPPKGYSSWKQYQRENQMVTLRGMQGGEQVTKNVKLSNIRKVRAGGATYIPNFAEGRVNIGDSEIKRMMKRLRSGQSLTNRDLRRIESGIASGQSFKIPPLLRDAAAKQASFASQKAARGSGRATPKTPPSGAGERTRIFPTRTSSVRDSQGRFVGTGGASDVSSSGSRAFSTNDFQPPAVIQPSLAEQAKNAPPKATDFSKSLEERQYKQFKNDFTAGKIPSGGGDDTFKKFKTRLQFDLIEAELKKESKAQGRPVSFAELGRSKEGRKLRQNIVKAGLVNFKQVEATTARAVQDALLADAQTQLEKSGKGRFGLDSGLDKKAKGILQSPSGRRLSSESRAKFNESVESRKIARGQRLQGAGFGLSFAGALAAPVVGQGIAKATGNERAGSIASGALGGAATGASVGAFSGNPIGIAIGAGVGGILGGVSAALATANDDASKYSKTLGEQQDFYKKNIASAQAYVNAQFRLNDAFESGTASGKQIAALFSDIQRTFNDFQNDPNLGKSERGRKLQQDFVTATPEARREILADLQREGQSKIRTASTQAAFDDFATKSKDRRATIAAERTTIKGVGQYAFGSPVSRVTNQAELNLSKITKEEVSLFVGGLLADIDLDNVDFSTLEASGTNLQKLLALGLEEETAKAFALQFDENRLLSNLFQQEIGKGSIKTNIIQQQNTAAITDANFKVAGANRDSDDASSNLFQAQAGQSAAARITQRGQVSRASNLKQNQLEFLSGQGFDQTRNKQNLQISDLQTALKNGLKDLNLGASGGVQSAFKDRLSTFTPEQRAEVSPILEKVANEGASISDINSLIGTTKDKDLKQELTKLAISLAANRDALVANTNQSLADTVAINQQRENQRVSQAALNDLGSKTGGQNLSQLFGEDKAGSSLTEEIRKGMRETFLGLDRTGLPGRDPIREVLADKDSPEAQALKGASDVLREQFNLVTRSKGEGGQLTDLQSKRARSIFERELSIGDQTPEGLADLPARLESVFDRLSDQGVKLDLDELVKVKTNTGEEIGGFEVINQGLAAVVESLKVVSPTLASLLSDVTPTEGRLPGAPPVVEGGNQSSTAADSAANVLAALKVQEAAALVNRDAIATLVEQLNANTLTQEQFIKASSELSERLAEGVIKTTDVVTNIDIKLPDGSIARLGSVEEAVEEFRRNLESIVDTISD
jgi:TP901 family phage tail tape measure protein